MNRLNPKAWAILNEDEQLALNLQLVMQKSTWEAGEVMGKAHYKYLEIASRGEHFIKLFTEHFYIYRELVPQAIRDEIGEELSFFIEQVILKRVKVRAAHNETDRVYGFTLKRKREAQIAEWFINNADSDNLEFLNFINMVKEFDRWNNFRVLPDSIQEPSAYKRRNKNIHRRHIKTISKLPEISIDLIQKICQSRIDTGLYSVILSKEKDPIVLKVKANKVDVLTSVGIYIWDNRADAEKLGKITAIYTENDKRHCKVGLDFWPDYRETTLRALNYMQIQKMAPSRKYLMMALTKLEFYNHPMKTTRKKG